MATDWAAFDTLIRELGGVVSVAAYARGSEAEKAAVAFAISEASDAVNRTISDPTNATLIAGARAAIESAAALIVVLDGEVARSRKLGAASADRHGRARELIEGARRAHER